MNGVIEKSSGDLIRAGFVDFSSEDVFDSSTEEYRTDVPGPKVRDSDSSEFYRWNGSSWVLVSQRTTLTAKYVIMKQSGNRITNVCKYATDNGDGTYSDMVEEEEYSYDNNKIVSITTTWYYSDGTVQNSDTLYYFTDKNGNLVKKES